MNIDEGLKQMWNSGIRELNIYWLESNEAGDEYWWCDIINDDLNDLCKTSWIWTVISRVEHEKDEELGDSTSFEDWLIIVDEEKFSDDLVGDQIKRWLRDRGFEFEVEVIDSTGTRGEKQMLDIMNEIFIRCACGTEGINITQDEDTGEVYFAMMYTDPCRMSAMDKLRWIIQILQGKPYPDQIVITRGWLPLMIDHLKAMQKQEITA